MRLFIGWLLSRVRFTAAPYPGRAARRLDFPLIPLASLGMSGLMVLGVLGLGVHAAPVVSPRLKLQLYSRTAGLPQRVVQVKLDQYHSISQYHFVIDNPDYGDFGSNACGFLAAAQAIVMGDAALSGDYGPAGTLQGVEAVLGWMDRFRDNAVRADGSPTYTPATGIQPSDFLEAVRASGVDARAENDWTLQDLYQALADGQVVIVDLRVNQAAETPSTQPDTFAHFARVLGIDLNQQQIYIENTLSQNDGSYWTLSFEEFLQVWQYPETQATLKPSLKDTAIQEEPVTNWAMVFSR